METLKDCVLSLVAESKTDSLNREYVSEGLYTAALALENGNGRVISSDILGPNWFPNAAAAAADSGRRGRRFSDTLVVGEGMATLEDYKLAVTRGDVMTVDEMRKRIIDPSWRLTEAAAEIMCDFTFIKQTPILNLLNGFEYVMDNVFKNAANLVSKSEDDVDDEEDLAWLVDAGMLLTKEGRTGTTVADVVMGRARRVVALFLGYTLVDVLKWKNVIFNSLQAKGMSSSSFEFVPPNNVDYARLIKCVDQRITAFLEGTLDDVVSRQAYVIPTVSNVLANVSAAVKEGFYPRVSGAFYEAILGYEIMSLLSPLISAEYFSLLTRSKNVSPPSSMRLERYEDDDDPNRMLPRITTTTSTLSDQEKEWLKTGRAARNRHSSEVTFADHPFLSKAIGGLLGSDRNQTAVEALHREADRESACYDPFAMELHVVKKRQVNFSNFSVLRVSPPNSAARFSMYALWNSLFLSTGRLLLFNINGTRNKLLVQFVFKDLHALFSCSKCEYGFLVKSLDTFATLEREKMFSGTGREEIINQLKSALEALSPSSSTATVVGSGAAAATTTVGEMITAILATNQEMGNKNLGLQGKMRQKEQDASILNLDKGAYTLEAAKYVNVSKGFTALAFYLLYASMANAPPTIVTASTPMDRAVFLLLMRWDNTRRFSAAAVAAAENLRDPLVSDQSTSSLLAFAAFWALRNAARARRKIGDPLISGTGFKLDPPPGRPLSLLSALANRRILDILLTNSYVKAQNVDSRNLFWRGLEEMQAESEIWSSGLNMSTKRRQDLLAERNRIRPAKLAVEPSGKIPEATYVRELFPTSSAVEHYSN